MTDKPKGQPEITQTKAAQPTEQLESQLDNQTIAQPESSDDFRQRSPQKDWHY